MAERRYARAKRTSPPGISAEGLLADDAWLPAQQDDRYAVPASSVSALAIAMLVDAVRLVTGKLDRSKDTSREVEEARRWIRSPAEHWGSFRWCCERCGYDPDAPDWTALLGGDARRVKSVA